MKKEKNIKKRILLENRQVEIVMKDLIEFGYSKLTFDEVRKIANQIANGTHNTSDPVARIICGQIDEAMEMVSRKHR